MSTLRCGCCQQHYLAKYIDFNVSAAVGALGPRWCLFCAGQCPAGANVDATAAYRDPRHPVSCNLERVSQGDKPGDNLTGEQQSIVDMFGVPLYTEKDLAEVIQSIQNDCQVPVKVSVTAQERVNAARPRVEQALQAATSRAGLNDPYVQQAVIAALHEAQHALED